VRNLRDTRIAHFIPAASHEFLTLTEIEMMRDDLNTLLQALSFDVEWAALCDRKEQPIPHDARARSRVLAAQPLNTH